MKFTDGFWRYRDDYKVYNAAKVFEYEIEKKKLIIQAPHFNVQNRGETLWGPLLEVELTSPLAGVIRVKISHYKGGLNRGPRFELADADPEVAITEGADALVYKSGDLEARVALGGPWKLEFWSRGKKLTGSGNKAAGYVTAESGPDRGKAWVKEELDIGVGELVYGLGERFTPFAKNGQVVESWNADGGTSSELSYKAIPLYLSSKGYGVLVDDCGPVSFEVGSEKVERVIFSVPGESLEYLVFDGPSLKDVLGKYTALAGRPALPPAWSFGLWLTTSFVTDYDEATVSGFIEGMEKRGIPLEVFHFDCFWMRAYRWTDFLWDPVAFPDPAGFLRRLKARGLKVCVWINPYIAQRSALFEEGRKNGYLLKRPDGSVHQVDTWQPGMGFVDFTNPAAREWYAGKIRALMDVGVDCFKTDFGERIPEEDVVWHDGSDPLRMHNWYPQLYNETVFGAVEGRHGEGKALVFARSATVGGQKFPVHWGGDCTATYESMAESLRGGLSLCLSGFGFWSHDISGFEMTATADLYKRWAAFGLLSSHSRLHGNGSYRVPWLFDDEACDVVRSFARLKCSLMPYIFAGAAEAARKGVPLMRAMVLEFQGDPACAYLDRQYMLGPDLLVAPVFSPDGEAEFYLPGLPKGKGWIDLFSGARLEGGRWRREPHGYMTLPLLAREGSMIAFGSVDSRPDYDYSDSACFHLFGLPAEGEEATAAIVQPDGSAGTSIRARREGGKLVVTARSGGKPWSLLLRGLASAKPSAGAVVESTARGLLVRPAAKGDISEFVLEGLA